MDQLNRPAAALNNRRRKPTAGEASMVQLTNLERNPLALTILDGEAEYSVSAERGKAGKVWLTCQCAESQAEGWCRHRLELLCFRFDAVRRADPDMRRAFERLVLGTPLREAGLNADRALRAFSESLRLFDERRPARTVGANLGKFTDLVSDLAVCSSDLEDALGVLRRLLDRS